MNSKKGSRTIKVDYLARVEGEGGLFIQLQDGDLKEVQLKIFEPPRFFEGLLRDRQFSEAPDITARICGICPVAYQMSACHALEDALGVEVPDPLRSYRRLLYCAEWIESHALHIYMLHAPDFLGYHSAVELAKVSRAAVERGLRLKKAGNQLLTVLGGRDIHPINVKVGGFYRIPERSELDKIRDVLLVARDDALETVRWVSTFDFPDFERAYEFVALQHPDEYPMNEGRVVSNAGLDIPVNEFDDYFFEEHVAHSNALHCIMKGGREYLVGPLARYTLNYHQLSAMARTAAIDAGLGETCFNPFKSIIVRSVETLYACDEALRILETVPRPEEPSVPIAVKAGIGFGCTEAPRGILYHRYEIAEDGKILDAKIVPPTSQNQKSIESDLRELVEATIQSKEEELQHRCEVTIRNYDPCISCATHFLKLHIDRGAA